MIAVLIAGTTTGLDGVSSFDSTSPWAPWDNSTSLTTGLLSRAASAGGTTLLYKTHGSPASLGGKMWLDDFTPRLLMASTDPGALSVVGHYQEWGLANYDGRLVLTMNGATGATYVLGYSSEFIMALNHWPYLEMASSYNSTCTDLLDGTYLFAWGLSAVVRANNRVVISGSFSDSAIFAIGAGIPPPSALYRVFFAGPGGGRISKFDDAYYGDGTLFGDILVLDDDVTALQFDAMPTLTQEVLEVAIGTADEPSAVALACPVGGGTGTVGEPYGPYDLNDFVTGGTAPFTFEVTAGSLPPGVSLDGATGIISGTPTTQGTFNYTVTVTDAEGTTAETDGGCTVNVAAAPPPEFCETAPAPSYTVVLSVYPAPKEQTGS